MKRTINIIRIIVAALLFTGFVSRNGQSVFADDNIYVYDDAENIDDAYESELNSRLGELSDKYDMDICISNFGYAEDIRSSIINEYYFKGIGRNRAYEGILLFYSDINKELEIMTTGAGKDVFYKEFTEVLESELYSLYDRENPKAMLEEFVRQTDVRLQRFYEMQIKAFDEKATVKMMDFAKVLSDADVYEMQNRFIEISDRYDCDITAAIVNDEEPVLPESYASDYMILGRMGEGRRLSAIMLMINKADGSIGILAQKEAREIFNADVCDMMEEALKSGIKAGDFKGYVELYIRLVEEYFHTRYAKYDVKEAVSENSYSFVEDEPDYLSEELEAELEIRLARLSKEYDIDLSVAVKDSYSEETVDWAAIRYIEAAEMGKNKDKSAFVLFISKEPRRFSLMARDKAEDVFFTVQRESILDDMLPYMRIDRYDDAVEVFADGVELSLFRYRTDELLARDGKSPVNIIDEQDKISSEIQDKMEDRLKALSDRYDIDIVVAVEDSQTDNISSQRAMSLMTRQHFGKDRKRGSIILFINSHYGDMMIMPSGAARLAFNDYALSIFSDLVTAEATDYKKAIKQYADYAEKILKKAESGKPYDENRPMIMYKKYALQAFSLAIPGSIILFIFILKQVRSEVRRLKSLTNGSAIKYMGKIDFEINSDVFISESVTHVRHPKNKSGSSGRSSSYSRGGSSYGGSSSRY